MPSSSAPAGVVRIALISFGSPWHYALWNNLSVDTLAGHLEGEFGDSVEVLLWRADSESGAEQAVGSLQEVAPQIVGLSVELGTLKLVDRFIRAYRRVRFERMPLLVLGNQVPTYFPERFLNDSSFRDALVCLHEGEKTIAGLVQHVRGERNLSDIPNLVYLSGSDIVRTPLQTLRPEELIHPPAVYTARPGITNMVQASRGCVFSCSFCTRHQNWNAGRKLDAAGAEAGDVDEAGSSWRPLPLTRVFENVERLVKKGIHEIEFCDDEFFGGRSEPRLARVEAFARGMRDIALRNNTPLRFRLFTTPLIVSRVPVSARIREQNARVEVVFRELIAAGLTRVYIGLESANVAQKLRYNRTETLDDTTLALRTLRQMKLDIDVGFIMFDPYLTVDEMLENVRYFREQDLVRHNTWPFRPLVVNEGTAMKNLLAAEGLLTGHQDPDFLSYEYRFRSPVVGRLCEIVQTVAKESAPIFYALKTISKSHWRDDETDENRYARQMCEANAFVYLDLMEQLGRTVLKSRRNVDEDVAVQTARAKIIALVNDVRGKVRTGVFDKQERDKATLVCHIKAFDQTLRRPIGKAS